MKQHFRLLRDSLLALRSEWKGALPALLIPGSDAAAAVESMSDTGLVRVVDALSSLARAVGSLHALVAGEVARRSRPELGLDGLAKSQGFPSPAALLAQSAGMAVTDAVKLITVGEATTGHCSFSGERVVSAHPSVQAALEAGRISVPAAALITRMLERVAPRAVRQDLQEAEESLTARAAEFSLEALSRLVAKAEGYLDPGGAGDRGEVLRARRSLTIVEEDTGAIVVKGRFDPVTGAPIKAAIEALVAAELRRARDAFGSATACVCPEGIDPEECGCTDPAVGEKRTMAQLRADAMADLATHVLGCEESTISATWTLVARIDAADLQNVDSVGVATIDGINQPISAASARGLAASAGIIPMVLGGNSAPLDLGYSHRLFSKLQKIALADRDGGCAHPGCTRPPSFCQAHHIRWWERHAGPTDISNGVLLCSYHHHLLHQENWVIHVVDDRTWFIPPVHIDPEQRPRAGNSNRRALPRTAVEAA